MPRHKLKMFLVLFVLVMITIAIFPFEAIGVTTTTYTHYQKHANTSANEVINTHSVTSFGASHTHTIKSVGGGTKYTSWSNYIMSMYGTNVTVHFYTVVASTSAASDATFYFDGSSASTGGKAGPESGTYNGTTFYTTVATNLGLGTLIHSLGCPMLFDSAVDISPEGGRTTTQMGAALCDEISKTQTVQVRYQNADGSWGSYSNAINAKYLPWATVSWSRNADSTYKAASVSYTAGDSAQTKQVSVARLDKTISFNANGGSGSMSNQTVNHGTATPLKSNSFTAPSGYAFGGWATSAANAADGIVAYTNQESISATANTTLYAIWKKTISFKSGIDGSTLKTTNQYYGGSGVTVPSGNASIGSWNLAGWSSGSSASRPEYASSSFDPGSSTTLYAVYSRELTVSYDGNGATGGSVPDETVTQYYNSAGNISPFAFTLPTNGFTRPNYTFVSWDDGDPGGEVNWSPEVDDSEIIRTVKAVWESPEYGGTEDPTNPDENGDGIGDNIALSAPTDISFVVKANGDFMTPDNAVIQNHSSFDIRISSVKAEMGDGWAFTSVEDFATASAKNTLSMTFGPAGEELDITDFLDSKSSVGSSDAWEVSANGQTSVTFTGKAKNITGSADVFGEIHWYVKAAS